MENLRNELIISARKDNLCSKEEEPLMLLVAGALKEGPNFRKAAKFAGISRRNINARKWWKNLHNGHFMTSKSIHFDMEEDTGIQLCLAMAVGQGHLEMKRATESQKECLS
jgi:hypothetical protein